MACRGIRGATTVVANTRDAILNATRELLTAMAAANGVEPTEIASAIFTTTPDLTAEFPAVAARSLGWEHVPLLCGHEMAVPGSLPFCLRILLHVNTEKRADEIEHIYLGGAMALRPDLNNEEPTAEERFA